MYMRPFLVLVFLSPEALSFWILVAGEESLGIKYVEEGWVSLGKMV